MFATFQNAMQRRECRIAGVRLRSMTLAQAYCLYAWSSPVLCGGMVGLNEFAVALWTCSEPCWPFHRFVDAVNAGKPEKMLARLGRRYDLKNFPADRDALAAWVEWHCATPPRFVADNGPQKSASAPWPMVVAVQLIPMLGEARTWECPIPLAMGYKIALDNASGDTSWKSEQEEALGYANGGNSQSNQ